MNTADSAAKLGAVRRHDRVDALLAERAHLVVGEGAIERPEAQREREAHPCPRRVRRSGRRRTARRCSSSSPPARASVVSNAAAGTVIVDDEREVDATMPGNATPARAGAGDPRPASNASTSISQATTGADERERVDDLGRDLADCSDRAARRPTRARRGVGWNPSTVAASSCRSAMRSSCAERGEGAAWRRRRRPGRFGSCGRAAGVMRTHERERAALVRQRLARRAAARRRCRSRTARRRVRRARRCTRPRAARPGSSAGRRIDSSARNGFSTSITPSGRSPAAARSAGASSGREKTSS